jgi:hypothetical protein
MMPNEYETAFWEDVTFNIAHNNSWIGMPRVVDTTNYKLFPRWPRDNTRAFLCISRDTGLHGILVENMCLLDKRTYNKQNISLYTGDNTENIPVESYAALASMGFFRITPLRIVLSKGVYVP